MRGKVSAERARRNNTGITPAYAGKSCILPSMALLVKDHPRVCGEKWRWPTSCRTAEGSPPRMRGKVPYPQRGPEVSRITPAYAGKSFRCFFPRFPYIGSPPRMRGKALKERKEIWFTGITPAYAGKRLKRSRSTVPPVAIVPLFPSVCNKPVVSDGSPAGRDAPLFLPAENAVPASPAYNLRSL